jgi:3-deoxy-D-manno-octulosonic-acid transferase
VRIFYNLAIYLVQIPLAIYYLFRGLGNRVYRDRFGQRFGLGYPRLDGCLWIHAVSVGEVQAAAPLVRALARKFTGSTLLITTVTPTGAARVEALFGDSVIHCYIPFELPTAINRFFDAVKPTLALIMETEIWPNLYQGCGTRNVPLVLVSARISPRSVASYKRFLSLFRETLSHGVIIAAQSDADAERFRSLGATPVRTWVTGNIKFDADLKPGIVDEGRKLRATLFGDRPIWIAASTHDQEEQPILNAHRELQETYPDLLLIVVPRHPPRFKLVVDLVKTKGFRTVSRTDDKPCDESTEVFVVDTMGELPLFYACSDIAFVGGSLTQVGGHNLLEPAALAMPIISGPHVFNAQDIADMFVEHGACQIVKNAAELVPAVSELLDDRDEAARKGEYGRQIIERNRGALKRLLALLEPLIGPVES